MSSFRRICLLSTAVLLAFQFVDAVPQPQMHWVTNPQMQMGILPAEVQTHYTGNRNYGRPSVRTDFYRDYLFNPDTSYFKYPFFHSDYSPTNYINAQWTSTTVRTYDGGAGQDWGSRVAPSVREARTVAPTPPDQAYRSDYYYSYYPTTTARSTHEWDQPQPNRPNYNYNYNYNYGNGNGNSQTTAPTPRPQVIDDYWNSPQAAAPARVTTTTEQTLPAYWYAGSTTTTRRIPSESQVQDWETVPTTTAHEWDIEATTSTTPRPTTTTTTTPRTTTVHFETEDEIKAEAEVEDSGPRDENEDDDSDDDDDDDEDEWDLDF